MLLEYKSIDVLEVMRLLSVSSGGSNRRVRVRVFWLRG